MKTNILSTILASGGVASALAAQSSPLAKRATNLCDQYGNLTADGYNFNNNVWGKTYATSGSECLYVNSTSTSGVSWTADWTWAGGATQVKSYPYSGVVITAPKLVSAITSLPSTYNWTYSDTNINADVSYDLFTAANKNHVTYSGDYELMIWLAKYGSIGPLSTSGSPIATVTLEGHSWNLYSGGSSVQKTYSFVTANGPINNFSGDIYSFFKYLIQNESFPASSQYLITFQGGTEPFTGGPTTLTVKDWSAAIN